MTEAELQQRLQADANLKFLLRETLRDVGWNRLTNCLAEVCQDEVSGALQSAARHHQATDFVSYENDLADSQTYHRLVTRLYEFDQPQGSVYYPLDCQR